MYLASVEINNFRSFKGNHIFDFKFKDRFNFNLIFGKTGVGKSIFVDAIYWCLYSKEILNFPTQPLYNYDFFNELKVGNELSVIVSCKFVDDGEIIEVKREASFIKKSNNKSISINPNSNLSVIIHSEDGNVESGNDMALFERYPEFLFSFLFYDDENSDFFEKEYSILLKRIIAKYGMFDAIDSTNSHIHSLLNQYIKENKKMPPNENLGILLGKQDKLLEEQDEIKDYTYKISRDKQKLSSEILKIDMMISNHSDEAYKLIKRRQELSNKLKVLEEKIDKYETRKGKLLFKLFPNTVLFSKCGESNKLDNLLENPNIPNSSFSKRYNQIKELYYNVPDINLIKQSYKYSSELKHRYYMISEELTEINDFFKYCYDENISNLEVRRTNIENQIQYLNGKLYNLKFQEDFVNKSLRQNKNLIKKSKKFQYSHNIIHRKITFCENAEKYGFKLKKEFIKHIISKIEGYCNHTFFHYLGMMKFGKIVLNDSFDIQIFNHYNQLLSINDLSSGEKKLVRLTLIFSIYRCFGLKFPIILMDPFSKLNISLPNRLFNYIFDYPNYQFIFILNDNQYNESIKHNFLNDGVVYQLIGNYGNTEVISHEKQD